MTKVSRDYLLYALASLAFAAFDWFDNHVVDHGYIAFSLAFVIAAAMTNHTARLTKGRLSDTEFVNLFLGIVFLGLAVFYRLRSGAVDAYSLVMAAVFIGLGVNSYWKRRKRKQGNHRK